MIIISILLLTSIQASGNHDVCSCERIQIHLNGVCYNTSLSGEGHEKGQGNRSSGGYCVINYQPLRVMHMEIVCYILS